MYILKSNVPSLDRDTSKNLIKITVRAVYFSSLLSIVKVRDLKV